MTLIELIPLSHIQVNCDAKNWQHAIQITAKPLLDYSRVEKAYIDRMIFNIYTHDIYIVIMPRFALVHASPGRDVHEDCISIATFQKDIVFHQYEEPVKIIMCVACVSELSHICTLKKIARTLSQECMIEKMCACQSRKQLYQLFQ